MSDFGLFEVTAAEDSAPDVQQRVASKRLNAAIYDVHQVYGRFLLGASGLDEFEDRWHYSKTDIRKTVEPHLLPVTGVMRRVHDAMKKEWKARTAAEVADSPDHPRHQSPDWEQQGMSADEWNKAGRPGWKTNNPKNGRRAALDHATDQHIQETFRPSDNDLIPQDNWEGYKDSVDQGGPEKVEGHDFGSGGDTGKDRSRAGRRHYADPNTWGAMDDQVLHEIGDPMTPASSLEGFINRGPKEGFVLDLYTDWARSNGLRVASTSSLMLYSENCTDNEYRQIYAAIKRAGDEDEKEDEDREHEDEDREREDEDREKEDEDEADEDSDDEDDDEGDDERDKDEGDDDKDDAPPWLTGARNFLSDVAAAADEDPEDDEQDQGASEPPPQDPSAAPPAPGGDMAPQAPPPDQPPVDAGQPPAQLENQPAEDHLLDTANDAVSQMIDRETQEYQQKIDPLSQALQAIEYAQQVERQSNPMDVTPPDGTVDVGPQDAATGAPVPDLSQQGAPQAPPPQQLQQQAFRIAQHFGMTEDGYRMLLAAMGRRHYQTVADAIAGLPVEHRAGIAASLGDMFAAENPRFRHDPFYAAAGVDPRVVSASRLGFNRLSAPGDQQWGPLQAPLEHPALRDEALQGLDDSGWDFDKLHEIDRNNPNRKYGPELGPSHPGGDFPPRLLDDMDWNKWNEMEDASNAHQWARTSGMYHQAAGITQAPMQMMDSFKFPGQTQPKQDQDSLTITPTNFGDPAAMTAIKPPKKAYLDLDAKVEREAKGVMDMWNQTVKQRSQKGLVTDPEASFSDFSEQVKNKVSPDALTRVKQKVVPSAAPKPDTPSPAAPSKVAFFTRRVPGWDWNDHLAAYTANEAAPFTCKCGSMFDVPAYYTCRCGAIFNSYPIGSGGDERTASVDMYLCREIPVRPDVIMANRRVACDGDCGGTCSEHTEWVTDEDREDADAPHAPGKNAYRLADWAEHPEGGWAHSDGGRVVATNDGRYQLYGPTATMDPRRPGPLAKLKSPHPDPQALMNWYSWAGGQGAKPSGTGFFGGRQAGIGEDDHTVVTRDGDKYCSKCDALLWDPNVHHCPAKQATRTMFAGQYGDIGVDPTSPLPVTPGPVPVPSGPSSEGGIRPNGEVAVGPGFVTSRMRFGEMKPKEDRDKEPTKPPKNPDDRGYTLTDDLRQKVKDHKGTDGKDVEKHVKGDSKKATRTMFGDWTKYDDDLDYGGPSAAPSTDVRRPPPDWARRDEKSRWIGPAIPPKPVLG